MNNAFRSFTDYCLAGIEANEDRLKEYVEKSAGIITAVNPHIGYEVAARIAREAILKGKSVRELCLQYDVLTAEELDLILNPYEMTNPGIAGAALFERE
jgi:aspartate ammonia-lyase